ncbi:MAG TPA: DUF429 domain-containing protein [Burkholderiaceae bacterium]
MTRIALVGVDFTSRPTRAKPIVVAHGTREGGAVRLERLVSYRDASGYARWLAEPGAWVGGFDLPFGLPRTLVESLGWPTDWLALMRHVAALPRAALRETFAAYCAARPAGAKFAQRACERPAGSSPAMKWVNPPVAYMLHAGVMPLVDAGVLVAGHRSEGDPRRVALEAYPGLLARDVLGRRPYKSDERAKQTPARRAARADLVGAIGRGHPRVGLRLVFGHDQRDALVDDASGDSLDASLCLLAAGRAATEARWGWPEGVDPLEGWIAGARG